MTAIAHYVPSERMHGILRVAAACFEADMLEQVKRVAREQLADDLAKRAARVIHGGRSGAEWYRYFLNAPETASKVDALVHATRTQWMRDPS